MARIHTFVEFADAPVADVAKQLKASGFIVVTKGDHCVIVDSDNAVAIRENVWSVNGGAACATKPINPDAWDAASFIQIHCPG